MHLNIGDRVRFQLNVKNQVGFRCSCHKLLLVDLVGKQRDIWNPHVCGHSHACQQAPDGARAEPKWTKDQPGWVFVGQGPSFAKLIKTFDYTRMRC
jgi:hypothetical protein